MATNDVWRLSAIGSHSGTEIAVCTMHIRMKTNSGTPEGAAAYLKTNLWTLVATQQATTFRWDRIVGLSRNLVPPVSAEYTTGFPITGGAAYDELPRQVALVVTHKTAYAGRRYRGRHYLPAMTEAYSGSGVFASTLTNALQTYYDDLVAALGVGGTNADYEWVVWSAKNGAAYPVKQAIVRNNPAVIRRRRVGVGQ